MYHGGSGALLTGVDTMGAMTDSEASDSVADPDETAADTGAPSRWEVAADLFAQWRDGRSRAMDDLVRLLTPVLWHVVRAYGLERSAAEDVVQTTWLTLVRSADTIHDPRAVAGWLTTCARREAWRAGKAASRTDALPDDELDRRAGREQSAAHSAEVHARDGALWTAVAAMDERCRRLLRIVAFEDRPDYARIARDLAMPIGSIGPTRQRCLVKLRSSLDAQGWGGDHGR